MVYFADDPYLDSDTINGVKPALVLHLEPGPGGVSTATFDVALAPESDPARMPS